MPPKLYGLCFAPIGNEKTEMLSAPTLEQFRKVLPTLKPIAGI